MDSNPQQDNSLPRIEQQPVGAPISPPSVTVPVGGLKIIQPVSNDLLHNAPSQPLAPAVPSQATDNQVPTSALPTIDQTETAPQSGSLQPLTSDTTAPNAVPATGFVGSVAYALPQAHFEIQENNHKKRKLLILSLLCAVLVVIAGAGGFYYWYSQQDHSIFSKLTTEKYDHNGYDFSFNYPSVMLSNPALAAKLENAPVAYTYYIGKSLQGFIAVSYYHIGPLLQDLHTTPSQFIAQIRSGSGSYVTALNNSKSGPNTFNTILPGCDKTIITASKQTTVFCLNEPLNYMNARVIGATSNYQYTMTLYIKPSLWTSQQKVWQEVEKSFSFQ